VIIASTEEFEISKHLQVQLEKAIKDANRSPEHEKVKNYRQKINKYFKHFEEFDKKASKFEDFDYINSAYEILFCLANLKSACSNEMKLSIGEIEKYLPDWINCCTKITAKFKFYEDFSSNFIIENNIKNNLLFFGIQEELLTEINGIKTNLREKSGKLNKSFFNKSRKYDEEIYSNFLLIIGLKSIYDLVTELEDARIRFKLLDPIFKKIIDFWKELTHELESSKELVKIFKESESYVKEYTFRCIIEISSKIVCLGCHFFKNLRVKKIENN
ncbi:8066_t:CDS:2, partial [Dentiscutata erythropus]